MTIMMSDSLVGRLDPSSLISSKPDEFIVKVLINDKHISCKIDKFKRSSEKIIVSFFSTPSIVEYFIDPSYVTDLSILRGDSKILEINKISIEIEIDNLNSPAPYIQLSIGVV